MPILPDVPGALSPWVPAAACPQRLLGSYASIDMHPWTGGLMPRGPLWVTGKGLSRCWTILAPLPWFLGPFPQHWPSTSSCCWSRQGHGDPGRCLSFSIPCSRCQHITCLSKATWHAASRESPSCGADHTSEPLRAGDLLPDPHSSDEAFHELAGQPVLLGGLHGECGAAPAWHNAQCQSCSTPKTPPALARTTPRHEGHMMLSQ